MRRPLIEATADGQIISARLIKSRMLLDDLPCLLIDDPRQTAFMAVTLGSVSGEEKTMSEREYYRLARLFFDGAEAEWIAARGQMSQAEVQAAWEFCREKLSNFFAAAAGEEPKLLSDTALRERSEDCVRLLLHWYEILSDNERWSKVLEQSRSDPGDPC